MSRLVLLLLLPMLSCSSLPPFQSLVPDDCLLDQDDGYECDREARDVFFFDVARGYSRKVRTFLQGSVEAFPSVAVEVRRIVMRAGRTAKTRVCPDRSGESVSLMWHLLQLLSVAAPSGLIVLN